jgi:cardiolipin synthase A/B
MNDYKQAEDIQLIFSGDDYFDHLETIINESREVLHLQTYIYENDETGKRIAEALVRAANRKVKVFVLLDAYGCYPFSKQLTEMWRSSGIHFRLYSPLFSSESINIGRRLHHKIIVADKKIGLTAGINIANKYSGQLGANAWLDYAVLTKGAVCAYLDELCASFFEKRSERLTNLFSSNQLIPENRNSKLIRFRRNDWIKGKNEIHKSYLEALLNAKYSVIIVASYFLPGSLFLKLLKKASKRGVEIKIILAGKSDIPSLSMAEHFLFEFYRKNNIRIYEWTNSVMHAKAMMVDEQWITIGSYNINLLSHYLSIELNADIVDPKFINTFTNHVTNILHNDCTYVDTKKMGVQNKGLKKWKLWLAYHFYRIVMQVLISRKKLEKKSLRKLNSQLSSD